MFLDFGSADGDVREMVADAFELPEHFDENDAAEAKSVKITLADMDITEPMKISYYILDETHDEELIREEIVTGKTAAAYLTLPNFTTYLIKIEKAEL